MSSLSPPSSGLGPAAARTRRRTVFIVEPDEPLRRALGELFASVSLEVLAFANPFDFLAVVDGKTRGCVVMDICLPGMTGLQLQEMLLSKGVYLPLIILVSEADLRTTVKALKRGAFDLLDKRDSHQMLLDRIFLAIEEDTRSSSARERVSAIRKRLSLLSRREREIVHLLVQGKTTKQVATILGLSPKTVENHRSRVMEKMEAEVFADLLRQVWEGVNGNLSLLDSADRRQGRQNLRLTPELVA